MNRVEEGAVYLVQTPDEGLTIKAVWPSPNAILLAAHNPHTGFGPARWVYPGETVRLIGKLVGMVKAE